MSLTGDATSGAFRAHASSDAQARSDRLGRDGEGTSTGADSSAAKPGVPVPPDPLEEPLGRLEFDQETAAPAIEDLFHREPVASVPLDFDLRRDTGTSAFAVEQAGLHDIAEPIAEPEPETQPFVANNPPPVAPPPRVATDDPREMFGATAAGPLPPASHRRSLRWVIIGMIALGLGGVAGFAGFTGRFFVGRDEPATPAGTVAPPPGTVAPPSSSPSSAPAATGGQNFTDAAVDDPAVPAPTPTPTPPPPPAATPPEGVSVPAPGASSVPSRPKESAARPPAPQARNRTSARPSRAEAGAPVATGPAAMMVDSRPAGAQVFVDGRSVGYTPIVVSSLTPGTHSVRMEIPGYRPWVTAVTLSPGARQRVAASLEQ